MARITPKFLETFKDHLKDWTDREIDEHLYNDIIFTLARSVDAREALNAEVQKTKRGIEADMRRPM